MPVVGCVAAAAAITKRAGMRIVAGMAGGAVVFSLMECGRHMARLAGDDGVLANKRKGSQVVFKIAGLIPVAVIVTALAGLSQSFFVRVIQSMTAETIHG